MSARDLVGALVLFCSFAVERSANSQGELPQPDAPLENDCFLPTSRAAEEALLRGDESLALARKASAAEDAAGSIRAETAAFEAWHDTLEASQPGESVWFEAHGPDPAADRRLTEGVEAAVWRRLSALSPKERARWRERFEELAERDLVSARDDPEAPAQTMRLAGVLRAHPGTLPALRAAIELGDRAFEEGRNDLARGRWMRASLTAAWIGAEAESPARGLESRLTACSSASQANEPMRAEGSPAGEPWRTADDLVATGAVDLPDPSARLASYRIPEANTGLRPGLAFLAENRLAVQTPNQLFLIRIDELGKLHTELPFDPAQLLPGFQTSLDGRIGRRPPGWPLLPAARDGDLVLVVGKGSDEVTSGEASNALLVVRPEVFDAGLEGFRRVRFPELRWAVFGDRRLRANGEIEPLPELSELAGLEFQPGPAATDSLVLVQARERSGEFRSWLLAFDRYSGELAWKRLVAAGSELHPDLGRLGSARFPSLSAQPLLEADGLIFVGTHLGAGALLDVADGTCLWTLKCRRRRDADRGWDGGRPVLALDRRSFFWSPNDSDHLYLLRAAPLDGGSGSNPLFATPPCRLDESETLVGGDGEAFVAEGRAGRERTVSEHRTGGRRTDAIHLGPGEHFPGRGVVSRARVLVASDRGLYLFDRSRELYLLDREPFPARPPLQGKALTLGGDVYARGAQILVLSRDGLFAFQAR